MNDVAVLSAAEPGIPAPPLPLQMPITSGSVLGFWADQSRFLIACTAAREAGFPGIQAFAPYPVHGMETAMGHRPSWIGRAVLLAIAGGAVACHQFFIQSSVIGWPQNVSGKPYDSPEFWVVPIMETALLAGALVNLLSCFHACKLMPGAAIGPDPRVTDDRFCLLLPACGERYTLDSLTVWLRNRGADEIRASATGGGAHA